MKAMILGAGRIGRGFVSELLHANQVEITYFDASSVMVDKLNEKKEYTIHVLGAEELNTHMEGVQAHLFYDIDALCSCWKEADFLFTACGGKNMGNVKSCRRMAGAESNGSRSDFGDGAAFFCYSGR